MKRKTRFRYKLSTILGRPATETDLPYGLLKGVHWAIRDGDVMVSGSTKAKVEAQYAATVDRGPIYHEAKYRGEVRIGDLPPDVGGQGAEVDDVSREQALAAPPVEPVRQGIGPFPAVLTITQLPPNPTLVLCGQKHVLVGRSETLCLGDRIKCIPDPASPGYWKICTPLPRWKGDKVLSGV